MPGSPPTQAPPPKPKPKHHRLFLLSAPSLLALALAVLLATPTNPLPRFLRLLLGPKRSLLRPTAPGPVDDTTPYAGRPPCVLWMAPFASGGGYCSEAWSYVASLDGHAAAGASANFTLAIAHHGDLESPEFWLGLPEESKGLAYRLATARCELSRAVVVCHSEPGAWYPPMYESLPCPPTGYDEPAFVIGRTMFETDRVSPEHVRRCNQMDAVWVPTDFHVSTFVKSGVDRTKVVKVVQAVDVTFFDPAKHAALSLPSGVSVMAPDDSTLNPVNSKGKGFVFLSVFKWEQRKGWDVLLRAFLQEFSGADDVALYLLINAYHSDTEFRGKIRRFVKNSSIEEPVEGWAEVRMIDEHVPQSALPRLYKAADAFVLPSRGEGWGRPVVEAMAMELPVIVTNWSGPTEYLTEENGYPLDVDRLTEVTEGPFKGHLCAEPSIDRLRGLMRRVFGDRAEARRKGKKAREDMIKRFSLAIVARIVADQIQQALAVLRRRITEKRLPKRSLLLPTAPGPVGDTTPDAGRPPCVLWMAPFASGGGYCSEAWSYVASLDGHAAAGASTNFTLAIAHHGDLESPEFWLGLPEESKGLAYRLATTRCELSRAVVVCHSEPGAWYPPMYESLPCPPTGYDEPAFVIGRTMFETDRVSPEHVRRCNQMDAVWVPTDFHVSTFVKSGVDRTKVVKVVQAVDVAFFDPAKHAALSLPIGVSVMAPDDSTLNPVNSKGKGFVFLSVFKWEQRKGWDVLLRAFLQEFSGADDVALYLLINAYQSDTEFRGKIRRFVKNSSIEEPVEGWAEVRMIDEHVPQSALPRLYKAADAFVLPSRGEGWGRPVVEAMAMELPVIVTNWSGPTEYLTEENGYPLDVDRLTEVTEGPFKGHLCAEPSIDRLRGLMRRVFGDRAEARRKGKKAREDMIKRFSPAIVARIVADQIQQALAVLRRRITEM